MKNRNGTVKRVWLPGALFFFDAKKRAGTRSYNDGPWLCGHGERAAVKRDTKEEGKKKRRKSRWTKRRWEESFSKLTHIPRFVRRWYPRFVQRINVLGAGLSAVIFLSSPRLDSGGIHSNEWMNTCALSLSFSLSTNIKYWINEDSIAASVSITRAQAVAPAARGHLQF